MAQDKLKAHEEKKKMQGGSRPHSAQGGRVSGRGEFAESLGESVGFGGFGRKN